MLPVAVELYSLCRILTLVQHAEEGGVIEYLRSDTHGH